MLKVLLKKQIMEIFRTYFYDAKKNRARTRSAVAGYIVLFVFIMLMLGGIFGGVSIMLCRGLHAAGMDWMYFALTGLLSIFLGAFGSVFNTYSGLYLAKDNDLLLSMPIPVSTVMAARLLGVYLMGLMYSAVVMIPADIVYWCTVPLTAASLLGPLVLTALISVLVLTVSCGLGWIVAKVSLKLKRKSLITVLISVVFFAAYYFVCFRAQTLLADLLANAAAYGSVLQGKVYPLYVFGLAGTGALRELLLTAAVILALFGLAWYLIARSFLRLATSSGKEERAVYRERRAAVRSPSQALLIKELRRFVSSANYMLNCGFGTVLLPALGIVLLVKGRALSPLLAELGMNGSEMTAVLVCTAVCVLISMNNMAVVSVSLEGKNLWILKSLPLTPRQILRAKCGTQLLLTGVPTAFCLLCALPLLAKAPVLWLLSAAVCLLFVLFTALWGLYLGLKSPNLTWTSEIVAIKQNFSVFLAMLAAWLYAIVLVGGYFLLSGPLGGAGYLALFAAVTAALCAVLLVWFRKKSEAVWNAL